MVIELANAKHLWFWNRKQGLCKCADFIVFSSEIGPKECPEHEFSQIPLNQHALGRQA